MDDRNCGRVLFRSQFNSTKLPVVKRVKGFVVHDLNLYFKDLINADSIPDSQMHFPASQDNGMSLSHESSSQLDRSHSQADEIPKDESVVSMLHSQVETEHICHDILKESSCVSDHKSRLKGDKSSSKLRCSQVDENLEGESAVCSVNSKVESEEIRHNTARESSVVSDHTSRQEYSNNLKKAVNNDHDTADESESMFESNDEIEPSADKEPNAISPSPESIVSRTKFSVPITTVANIINSRSISQSNREQSDVGSSTSGQPLKYKHANKYCESQTTVALTKSFKDNNQAAESSMMKISGAVAKKQNKTRNTFESPVRKVRRIKYYTDEEVEGDESENSDTDDKQYKHKVINNVRNKSNGKLDNDSSDKNSEIKIIHLKDNMVLKDKEFVTLSNNDSMRDATASSSTEEILNADVLEIIDGDKLFDPSRAAGEGTVVRIAKKVEPESLSYSLDFDTSEDESGEMECETESENTEQRLKVDQCDIEKQSQEKKQRKEQVDQPREKGSDNTKILSKTDNSLKARGMDNAACSTIGLDKDKQTEDSSRTAVDKSSVAVDKCKVAEDRSKAIIDQYKATIDKCRKAVDKGKAAVNKEKSVTDKNKAADDSSRAALDKNNAVKDNRATALDTNKATEDCRTAAVDKNKAAADKEKAAVGKDKAAAVAMKAAVDKNKAAADKEKTAVDKNKAAADKDTAAADNGEAAAVDKNTTAVDKTIKVTAAEGMMSVEKSKSGADKLLAAGNINNEVRNNSETVQVRESKVVQEKEHCQCVKDKQGKTVKNVETTARESSKLDAKSEVSKINQVRECVNIGDKNRKIDASTDKPSHSGNNDDNCCGIEGWITTRAGLRTITRKIQIGRQDNESTAEKDDCVTGEAKKSNDCVEADVGGNGNDLSIKCSRLHNKYKFKRSVKKIDEEVEASSDQESCEVLFNDEGVASDDRQQDCRADTGVYTVIDSAVGGVEYMGGVNEGASTSRAWDNIGRKSSATTSAAGNTGRTETESERVIDAVISGSSSTDFVSPQPLNTGGQSMFFTARDQTSETGRVSPGEDLDVGWKGSKNQGATTRKGTQKKRKPWTEEEELIVYKGVQTYGVGQWAKFQHKLPFRSNIDIKDKWRVIQKQGREKYLRDLLKKQQ